MENSGRSSCVKQKCLNPASLEESLFLNFCSSTEVLDIMQKCCGNVVFIQKVNHRSPKRRRWIQYDLMTLVLTFWWGLLSTQGTCLEPYHWVELWPQGLTELVEWGNVTEQAAGCWEAVMVKPSGDHIRELQVLLSSVYLNAFDALSYVSFCRIFSFSYLLIQWFALSFPLAADFHCCPDHISQCCESSSYQMVPHKQCSNTVDQSVVKPPWYLNQSKTRASCWNKTVVSWTPVQAYGINM